jgi:arabinogalactan oligomer/maltooligosaccharide transport system substrate-binding protein
LKLALAIAAALGLAGCAPERDRGVVLWHAYTGAERDALETVADGWNRAHPDQPLTLVAVPYDSFADKLTSAIPNGNGPDLFIYAHDRIGSWSAAHLVEPVEFWVDETIASRFDDSALVPLAYDDSLWGLPLATKTLGLFYRTDLVAEPPVTTDALFGLGPEHRARGRYPLGYVGVELYGHAPWLFGHGGAVFDDAGELEIATAEAAAAAGFARRLVKEQIVPAELNAEQLASLFNDGKVAMALSGPWFIGDIAEGVPWKVTTLPLVSETGVPATPFLTAEGVLMSSRARDKDAAFAVMNHLTDDASAITRARTARQVVANQAAYREADVGGDPVLATFRRQSEHTVPMPASPTMRVVWRPYMIALQDILRGGDPGDALRGVEREVREGP